MPVDLSEFEALSNKSAQKQCLWSQIIADLDDERAAKVAAAVASPAIEHTAIAKVMRGWGFDAVKPGWIARHRNGDCAWCKANR